MPRHSITAKRIERYTTDPTSSAPGLRIRARMSVSTDNRHRRDLDRDVEGQSVRAERGSRVLARVTEYFDEKVRRAVDDLRLVAELSRAVHVAEHLRDGLDAIEAGGRIDLSEHAQAAHPRAARRLFDADHIRAPAREQLVAVGRHLAGD